MMGSWHCAVELEKSAGGTWSCYKLRTVLWSAMVKEEIFVVGFVGFLK